jgi:hypothetical protein
LLRVEHAGWGTHLGLHPQGYVIVCPDGHCHAEAKRLSDAQLRAVREVAVRLSVQTVAVGDTKGDPLPVDLDLRGQTNLRDLCALVQDALCVVTADTGTLHVAGAMQVPTLALCHAHGPVSASQDYAPLLTLQAPLARQIGPETVAQGLSDLIRAARVKWAVCGPERNPDGPAEAGKVAAQAAGVPYRTLSEAREAGGWHVAEAIETDLETLLGLDLTRTVLSLHNGLPQLVGSAAGVLFRGRALMREAGHLARRGWYVPLAAPWEATCDAETGLVGWHGILHPRKNLEALVAATRLAGKRLLVCGSDAPGHTPDGYADALRGLAGDGVEVDARAWWDDVELANALSRCEVLCYPDTMRKEQSAASQAALGFGRPVVVGVSTAHDEVRGWATTAAPDGLAEALTRVGAEDGARALLGASYRRPWAIARAYRAAVVQCELDRLRK